VQQLKDVSLIALDHLDSLNVVQLKLETILIQEYVKQDEGGNVKWLLKKMLVITK